MVGDEPDGILDVEDDRLLGSADLDGGSVDGHGLDGARGRGVGAVAGKGENAGLSIDNIGVRSVDSVELVTRAICQMKNQGHTWNQRRRGF